MFAEFAEDLDAFRANRVIGNADIPSTSRFDPLVDVSAANGSRDDSFTASVTTRN